MDVRAIYLPGVALVALTLIVWLKMFFSRVAQMKRDGIDPQRVATASQSAALLTDSRAADNFRNLFELPVLFYFALAVAAHMGRVDSVSVGLAWAFVVLRIAHSAIQVSYNRVMHRFRAYFASSMALWALWGYLAVALLRA